MHIRHAFIPALNDKRTSRPSLRITYMDSPYGSTAYLHKSRFQTHFRIIIKISYRTRRNTCFALILLAIGFQVFALKELSFQLISLRSHTHPNNTALNFVTASHTQQIETISSDSHEVNCDMWYN